MKSAYEKGISLFVVIIILLLVSLIAISGMSTFILEQRVTSDRIEYEKMIDIANSSLREAEFRFYGPAFLRDKIDVPIAKEYSHCNKSNTVKDNYRNKPCLLISMTNAELNEFYLDPIKFLPKQEQKFGVGSAEKVDAAPDSAFVAWMPFRGTDPVHLYDPKDTSGVDYKGYWNAYLIRANEEDDANVNPEYGASLEGRGVYYYLLTGQSNGQVAAQSTYSVIYVGLNN